MSGADAVDMTAQAREEARRAFAARHGWGDAVERPLAGDASGRRYFRLIDAKDARRVLMDAPPQRADPEALRARLARNDVAPFVRIAEDLRARGFSAPAIDAFDPKAGFCLMEDLGDDLFSRQLARGADERALYVTAAAALADLARENAPEDLPPYDRQAFDAELAVMADWWAPLFVPGAGATAEGLAHAFDGAFAAIADRTGGPVLTMRDAHADNLLWLPERDGAATVGLLDFQDALQGPAVYDLMSLLDDVRRVVDADVAEAATKEFLARTGFHREDFEAAWAVWSAQRQIKILGVFARLMTRLGRERSAKYAAWLPRAWTLLERAAAHELLVDVRLWLDAVAPPRLRGAHPPALS